MVDPDLTLLVVDPVQLGEQFWEPLSIKIGFKSDLKGDRFYYRFEDRVLDRFGVN